MTVQTRHVGTITVFEVHGALTSTEGQSGLRRSVRDAVDAGARHIVVNLSDVSDIDSSGVAELASGHITVTNRGGDMKLCCLSKKLKHIFKITRLEDVFAIYDTEADATAPRS